MQPVPLICPRCGAPLPAAAATSSFSTCAYCGTTAANSADGAAAQTRKALDDASTRFVGAMAQGLKSGVSPYDAVRSAAASHLGVFGQSEGLARIAVAIAADFDRENGTSTLGDALVLARIAQAYLKSLEQIRTQGQAVLNMPFLSATDSGPKHLTRTLTPSVVAELAARDPMRPAGASEASNPAKRKGWWPF